jgi:hypothetical protein
MTWIKKQYTLAYILAGVWISSVVAALVTFGYGLGLVFLMVIK